MKICIDCRHHHSKHDGSNCGPGPNVWFHHICLHPGLARHEATDPVTGARCFWLKSDFGRMVTTDEQYPHCRDINTEGECEFFVRPVSVCADGPNAT